MINTSLEDSYIGFYNIFNSNENSIDNASNPQILGNQNNYHESRTENQGNDLSNLLNNYNSIANISNSENEIEIFNDIKDKTFIDNSFIKIENQCEDNLININNEDSFKEQEKNKFILYLKKNNYINNNNNNILEKDILINKDKKKYEENMLNIMNKLKCKGCFKIPKEFFICSLCSTIFCENCLGKEETNNKNFKVCISCNNIVASKENFIKLPIFNKIISYINKTKENNEKLLAQHSLPGSYRQARGPYVREHLAAHALLPQLQHP